ncbi:MAG: cytidine deaminase [Pseudohongiellaceae bacterium]
MDTDRLIAMANEARAASYSPYSKFPVGAAVLSESGEIFTGCNVENASFGLTVCAERIAVFSAVAAGHQRLVAAAVVTPSQGAPCGACRQVLAEFGPEMIVHIANPDGDCRSRTMAELLPESFGPADLKAWAERLQNPEG